MARLIGDLLFGSGDPVRWRLFGRG